MAGARPEMDRLTQDKLDAEMNKVAAKYGGKDKLRAKYGKDIPPAIMAEIMKATMPLMHEQTEKQMQEQMPLMQKRMQGLQFYMMLKPENDPHYAGGGVKLGHARSPNLLVQAHRRREIPRHLRRSQRQRNGAGRGQEVPGGETQIGPAERSSFLQRNRRRDNQIVVLRLAKPQHQSFCSRWLSSPSVKK